MKHFALGTAGFALALSVVLGCGGKLSDRTLVGGETNWLLSCGSDADCVVGSCLCNRCTVECDALDGCSAGPSGSSCTVSSDLPVSCASQLASTGSGGGICLRPAADDLPLTPSQKGLDGMLETLARDLEAISAADQPFQRYLSVANLDNDFPLSPRDLLFNVDQQRLPSSELPPLIRPLREARAGLAIAKLTNSLSTALNPANPTSVGAGQLLVRIDLRAYDWDHSRSIEGTEYSNGWEAIVSRATLAVEYQGPAADHLKELSGTRVPWLFADDFVAAASKGEVYYALLGMPDTLRNLELALAVDDSTALRAAFRSSGVSNGPRIVERRSFRGTSSYWRVFDFDSEKMSAETLLANPDAPEPDGTEVMYELPNGLNAFFLADRDGRRVAESPLSPKTVGDPSQPDGVLRSAISCFSCHNAGVVGFQDQFRKRLDGDPSLGLSADERARSSALYPRDPAALAALVDAASQHYLDSIENAGIARDAPDSIRPLVLDFQRAVPPGRAAGELFVTPDALAQSALRLPFAMSPLTGDGGSVPRDVFANAYLQTLCSLQRGSENQPIGCP